jgi:hypothetical protein
MLEIKHCIVCEDVRLERRNLNSFMGVYGATPDVGVLVRNFDNPVNLCFLFMGPPGENEKVVIHAEIHSSDGSRLKATVVPESSPLTFATQFPLTFAFRTSTKYPGPNPYNIVVFADGKEFFKDSFRVVQSSGNQDFT